MRKCIAEGSGILIGPPSQQNFQGAPVRRLVLLVGTTTWALLSRRVAEARREM
jgi:hypothetical protein